MKLFAVLGKKKHTKFPTWVVIAENVSIDEAKRIKHDNRYKYDKIIICSKEKCNNR